MIHHSSIRNACLTPSIVFLTITTDSIKSHTHSTYDASLLSILFVMFKVFWMETSSSWLLSHDISSYSQCSSMIFWAYLNLHHSQFSPGICLFSSNPSPLLFSDERHIVSKHRPWMCALQLWYDCLRPFQWSEQGESCSCLYFQVQCQSDGIWEVIRFRWGDDLQSS